MQTSPIITTSPAGHAQQAAGASGSGDGGIFAALIQALTGAQATVTPVAASGPEAAGAVDQTNAADGDAELQAAEAGNDLDMAALAQFPGLELPPPPPVAPATPPAGGAAAVAPGASALSPASMAEAASAPLPSPASPANAALAATDAEVVMPPSAQAAELAKVLAAGTQVNVTVASESPAPSAPLLAAAASAAVAAALEETQAAAAAASPVRPVPAEPKKASSMTSALLAPADGDAAKTAARPASAAPAAGPAGAAAEKAAVAADGAMSTAATPSSTSAISPSPITDGGSEAAAPELGAQASSGRDGQAGANQAPAPTVGTSALSTAATPERAQAPLFAATPPAGQVSVHIAKAVRAGVDRIDIQLSPASLGRVEISLDLSDTQQVRASISAETKEALELLRADARVLERALQDVGLKTEPGSLSFQLRDQGGRAGHDGGSRQGYGARPEGRAETADAGRSEPVQAPRTPAPATAAGHGRIDIHA